MSEAPCGIVPASWYRRESSLDAASARGADRSVLPAAEFFAPAANCGADSSTSPHASGGAQSRHAGAFRPRDIRLPNQTRTAPRAALNSIVPGYSDSISPLARSRANRRACHLAGHHPQDRFRMRRVCRMPLREFPGPAHRSTDSSRKFPGVPDRKSDGGALQPDDRKRSSGAEAERERLNAHAPLPCETAVPGEAYALAAEPPWVTSGGDILTPIIRHCASDFATQEV